MGRHLYFPSEERRAEDFFALKNPTASVGFEPANLGTKCQHATSRPPKPQISLLLIQQLQMSLKLARKLQKSLQLTQQPQNIPLASPAGKMYLYLAQHI